MALRNGPGQQPRTAVTAGSAIVAGIGHAWLGDEAFGLKVVAALRARGVPPHVELADWSFGTIAAFQRLCEGRYASAVFVASAARERPTGVLYKHRAEDPLPPVAEIHGRIADCVMGLVNLDNLLVIGRYYGVLPPRVMVVEAEPVDCGWGDQLSPALADLVPRAVSEILDEIRSA